MKLNVSEFLKILKKSTINFSIDNVQIKITKDNVSSKMISSSSDLISILNVDNTIIDSLSPTDEIIMNFSEPNVNLVPYLNLLDLNEDVKITLKEEKIIISQGKQKSNIHYCAPQIVNVFGQNDLRSGIEYFKNIQLNNFINDFLKIKKIGNKFSKIYFGIDNNVFYIETSDKQNKFSNGLRIDLDEVVDMDDLYMCFDFKNVVNVMTILNDDVDDFTLDFAYVEAQNLGMVNIHNSDDSEKYFLMSRQDI